MTRPRATLSRIARTIEAILDEHGPLTLDQLSEALASAPLVLPGPADEVIDELEETDRLPLVVVLLDGRRARLPALIEGRTFTHRLNPAEARHDVLALDADLEATGWLVDEGYERLTDGRAVSTALTGYDDEVLEGRGIAPSVLARGSYLLLPAGFVAALGAGAGDVVGVTLTPDGWRIELVPDDALQAVGQERVARLVEQVRAPIQSADLVWWACAELDGFWGWPPMTELLSAWGLARFGDLVAPEGFDFDRWRIDSAADRISSLHGLDEDDAFAVAVLCEQFRILDDLLTDLRGRAGGADAIDEEAIRETPGLDADTLAELSLTLTEPRAAEALLAETLGAGRKGAAALGLFAESTQPVAPPEAQTPLGWLLAKAHERLGRVAAAEETLRDVVSRAPFAPALRDLARYESLRGHAAEAAALLRRAGVPARDAELALLDRMATTSARDLGRNQPCWCGSGRKYKVCHLGREELPLSERAGWLHHKAVAYVQDGPWRERLLEVAIERARWLDEPEALWTAIGDPLVSDTVLHEGGAFEAFLAELGGMLPEDERLMAQQWALCDRSLHEVDAVRPRASLTLRDLRTGDVVTVRERSASAAVPVGSLVLARVVPAGDTHQLVGGSELVRMADRDALLDLLDDDPEPVEIVALLNRRLAPPTLQNQEGEPLVLHRAEVRPRDLGAVVRRLDEALVPADEGREVGAAGGSSRTWVEEAEVGGMPMVRASVGLADGVLTVEANSDLRFDRIMLLLRQADPDLHVLDHEMQTGEELVELADRFPGAGHEAGSATMADGPEVADAVADLLRKHEDRWLDEAVPALAGLTPRQAVDDPTRRADVVRLLRSWPEPTPLSMNRDRLAEALGLDLGLG